MRTQGILLLLLSGAMAMAVGCGDDDSKDSGTMSGGSAGTGGGSSGGSSSGGTGGKGGSSATGGSTSSGGTGGSTSSGGTGGSTSSGGTGGTSGEAGAGGDPGAGGDGGTGGDDDLDPMSTACEDFPVTVAMGETIQIGYYGAILCVEGTSCRLTTNTYSVGGVNPCPLGNDIVRFWSGGTEHSANMPDEGHWVSATAGMIDENFPSQLEEIPADTEITGVFETADGVEYTVVFSFDDNNNITITSFTEN